MSTYKLEIFNGHPIIKEGENIILIDTGAPTTIHSSDRLQFNNQAFNVTSSYMGLTTGYVSELLGMNITTLMGMDVLSKFKFSLNYKNNIVAFLKTETEDNNSKLIGKGLLVLISTFMGIPIIELEVNNKKLKFFLDTGANISYLPEAITNNMYSKGTESDYYPGFGKFDTPIYELETKIGNEKFQARYGNLPQLLQMSLQLGNIDGIIGFDFFNNFNIILDQDNNKLYYKVVK